MLFLTFAFVGLAGVSSSLFPTYLTIVGGIELEDEASCQSSDSVNSGLDMSEALAAHIAYERSEVMLADLCKRILVESRGSGFEILPMDRVMIESRLSAWMDSDLEGRILIEQGLREFAKLRSRFVMSSLMNEQLVQYYHRGYLSAKDLLNRRLEGYYNIGRRLNYQQIQYNYAHMRKLFRELAKQSVAYKKPQGINPSSVFNHYQNVMLPHFLEGIREAQSFDELQEANARMDEFIAFLYSRGYHEKTIWEITKWLITPLITSPAGEKNYDCETEAFFNRAEYDCVKKQIARIVNIELPMVEEALAQQIYPNPPHETKYITNPFEM